MSEKRNPASLNEALKAKETELRAEMEAKRKHDEMALDDTQRVKVLSPGRLVFKRFVKNRLAIVGTFTLLTMFVFSFLVPLVYPYGQAETFFKYDTLTVNYATAGERTDYVGLLLDKNADIHFSVEEMLTSHISDMEAEGVAEKMVEGTDGSRYVLKRLGDKMYLLTAPTTFDAASVAAPAKVASFNSKIGRAVAQGDFSMSGAFENALTSAVKNGKTSFSAGGSTYVVVAGAKNSFDAYDLGSAAVTYAGDALGSGFESALRSAILAGSSDFTYGGSLFELSGSVGSGYSVVQRGAEVPALISTCYVLDAVEAGAQFSNEFTNNAMLALYGEGAFEADGKQYTVGEDANGTAVMENGTPVAYYSTFVVRRASGKDSLDIEFKRAAKAAVAKAEAGNGSADFVYMLPTLDESGEYATNEDGSFSLVETDIHVNRATVGYTLTCDQVTYLIDIYGEPTKEHIFGTDSDGFDILARMMYGGRISLLVGFVVVVLECLLGTILGGVAGYFGGWVDNLIMRLVDIFYCIPTYPILIILGSFFDSIKLGSYQRLAFMMAVLGFLGWAGIARMVRGQILSLREQEFMVAAEATGLATKRKIFRHLIPNVMPQLIVSATMGLGSVILTESTLSFLGLGVKHPLATWGTMINSITSSNENLIRYAYIWIPVGLLICLTVIAFNFVGDGLRDAFDPKMK